EAAADPAVRALAEGAGAVLAIAMFSEPLRGWVDLVLPATSYLERDGTMVNLEGRVQRLRRAVIPPGPDELAWISKLAARFGVTIAPEARGVFGEVSPKLFGGISMSELGERAKLPEAAPAAETPASAKAANEKVSGGGPLRLTRYRALFSGPAVDRVPELRFQRPDRAVELSPKDAS